MEHALRAMALRRSDCMRSRGIHAGGALSPGRASDIVSYLFVRSWVYHGIDSRLSGDDRLVDRNSKGRMQ